MHLHYIFAIFLLAQGTTSLPFSKPPARISSPTVPTISERSSPREPRSPASTETLPRNVRLRKVLTGIERSTIYTQKASAGEENIIEDLLVARSVNINAKPPIKFGSGEFVAGREVLVKRPQVVNDSVSAADQIDSQGTSD